MEEHQHNLYPMPEEEESIAVHEESETQNEEKEKKAKKSINWGRIFLGIIIIALGGIYLASNFNLIEDPGFTIWQLWPVLLIFAGLSLLSVRGITGALIGILVTVLTLGLISLPVVDLVELDFTRDVRTSEFQVERQAGTQESIIVLQYGAGFLNIQGTEEDFLSGIFESNVADLVVNSRLEAGMTQRINIGTVRVAPLLFGGAVNDLNVQLPSTVPTDLYIDAGAVEMDLDLTNIFLQGLDIDAGASTMDIIVSNIEDRAKIIIDAGAGDIHLTLPEGIGAELIIDAGALSKDLEGFDPVDSGHYLSTGFEDAEVQIEVHFNLAATKIKVDWAK